MKLQKTEKNQFQRIAHKKAHRSEQIISTYDYFNELRVISLDQANDNVRIDPKYDRENGS
ncbi:hypothetical protein DI53_1382 [Sphingobacterium deserti]|uniref:Uncharacterized protein n=1 Tax=Sphingobacterium deserti TaxID=1229276 RepID=A0A0B8T1J3_9SPHI|nr:hypothetical protein DI53_1382 [Sphingobacterium deserti]